jgi:hypothetical protein
MDGKFMSASRALASLLPSKRRHRRRVPTVFTSALHAAVLSSLRMD